MRTLLGLVFASVFLVPGGGFAMCFAPSGHPTNLTLSKSSTTSGTDAGAGLGTVFFSVVTTRGNQVVWNIHKEGSNGTWFTFDPGKDIAQTDMSPPALGGPLAAMGLSYWPSVNRGQVYIAKLPAGN